GYCVGATHLDALSQREGPTLMVLSLEIGRIEKEWMVEASGRTPKHRG
ncbi:hypothetical protein ACNJQJ_22615, partial [Mycobacterium tuberculosis]